MSEKCHRYARLERREKRRLEDKKIERARSKD
jgi:hypothetical protein